MDLNEKDLEGLGKAMGLVFGEMETVLAQAARPLVAFKSETLETTAQIVSESPKDGGADFTHLSPRFWLLPSFGAPLSVTAGRR